MARITTLYALVLAALLLAADCGMLEPISTPILEVPLADKVVHFVMFGLLALLANATLISGRLPSTSALLLGSLTVFSIATLEECSNILVDQRECSLYDLAANYLGILCVGVLPFFVSPRLLRGEDRQSAVTAATGDVQ